MKSNLLMNFSVDKENKKINVEREFGAPLSKVWSAWTESQLLDQWWAPKPWKSETKRMDFKPGGSWVYAMVGPEGETHWSRSNFKSVVPLKSYSGRDAFSDEDGNINDALPQSLWTVEFSENGDSTLVSIKIEYDKLSDLEATMDMGFKEGFTAGMENLDELLESQ